MYSDSGHVVTNELKDNFKKQRQNQQAKQKEKLNWAGLHSVSNTLQILILLTIMGKKQILKKEMITKPFRHKA